MRCPVCRGPLLMAAEDVGARKAIFWKEVPEDCTGLSETSRTYGYCAACDLGVRITVRAAVYKPIAPSKKKGKGSA